jgi:tetratricopeptide (TPR) repeat protein
MRKALALICLLFLPLELRASPEIRAILVFPFENLSPRVDLNWISESFAQTLSSRLVGPENYVLDRDERNAADLQLGMPPDAPLTLASEYKVAQTLGVDWAVVGSFKVEGNSLSARAQLLDVRRLKLFPPIETSGELPELIDMETRLAWRLLATHDPSFTVGSEEDFRRGFHQVRLDAYETYIRGLLATDDKSRVHFFEESDRLDPSDHRAAFQLGRFYFDLKDYANSVKWFRKLNAADPNYNEALFLLAVDEYFLGHEGTAEKALEELSKAVPLNEVSNNLGVLEARRGRYQEALADFDRAYQGDPTDPVFCFNRAVTLCYLKQYDEAAKALRETLRGNPDDSEAHTLLALVLGKMGDTASQREELQWLSEHEIGSPADLSGDVLAQPRLKKNYDGRAFRLLALALHNVLEERLSKLAPEEHSQFHITRGKKLLAEGRLLEAERELTEAVSLVPTNGDAHVFLAQILQGEGKYREAAAELQTALKLQDSVGAHLALARVYLSLNEPALALDQGRAALTLDPANQEAEKLMEQIPSSAPNTRKAP